MKVSYFLEKVFVYTLFKSISIFIFTAFIFTPDMDAQSISASVYGKVVDKETNENAIFANLQLFKSGDPEFFKGSVTNMDGEFLFENLKSGEYTLKITYLGYTGIEEVFVIGRLSEFLDLGIIELEESIQEFEEVEIKSRRDEISGSLDRRIYNMEDNISQTGGSLLQAMQNLPGVSINQDGELEVRGSNKVAVLVDGKQTAFTGAGAQSGLDNIPVSSIERIEIINNPSSKYDANAMAGIVNIIYKKEEAKGFNGSISVSGGIGSFTIPEKNIAEIREPYRYTPKINPGFSLNYRQNNLNFFVQGDVLWHKKVNRNEFFLREYPEGEPNVRQQFLENRTQPIYNIKLGLDWFANDKNSWTIFVLYNQRDYTDLGDLPYLSSSSNELIRLWEYYEYESNKTFMSSLTHRVTFDQPGHRIESSFNYSFRRKDEVFNFTDTQFEKIGMDSTFLIADENIFDLTVDYTKPHRSGRYEGGLKARARIFPNEISFRPGQNSILDLDLQGTAEYREWLYAAYGNYIFESRKFEIEAGLRIEYADIDYLVDPDHNTYASDGFDYLGFFPSIRLGYRINDLNNINFFYNRRVDRPEEKNLRVFPQYSDPEILPIGNPGLQPQFTHSLEIAYKRTFEKAYLYSAVYHRITNDLLTSIITRVPDFNQLVLVDQNAGKSYNSGIELIWSQNLTDRISFNINTNFYLNVIDAFSVINAYPQGVEFSQPREEQWTGNLKAGSNIRFPRDITLQLSFVYFAPDIIPQGQIEDRMGLDFGLKIAIQEGKGEIFINGTDLFNTMHPEMVREDVDFKLSSTNYFETRVFRVGYNYRFG
nr:TonB-dependent receptor [Saprospiraceae bacterium]